MSYIVLARKWRPQVFDDLIGQETIVRTLKNALSAGKVVHAYLFSGPRGVGKTSTARILAKALNCINAPVSEPCGKCQHCIAITEGSSVDVIEIDGASNTQVDSIRELRESVKYAPSSGRYKIYIIDEVHMLSVSAFNALLKTLEEPPSHVVFIFATTEPKKIPPTIHSRCQHHAFRRIPKDKIIEQLEKIITAEGINIKKPSVEMIARAADGSIRDALTLLDQVSAFSDDITEEEIKTLLGLPETEIILNLSQTIIEGNVSHTLSIIKELTDKGYDIRFLTKELVEHFRNLSVVKITDDVKEILEFTDDEIEQLRPQAASLTVEQLTLLLTELLKLEGEVRTAINPRYTLELGLLRMSFIKGMTAIDDILKMLGGTVLPPGNAPSKITPSTSQTREDENNPPLPNISKGETEGFPGRKKLDLSDSEGIWQKLVEEIDTHDHLLAGKLSQAKLINLSTVDMVIGFNGGMSMLAELIKNKVPLIEEKLYQFTGKKLRLKIITLPEEKVKKNNKSIKEMVISEPVVQGAIKLFNSSIIEVRSLKGTDNQGQKHGK